MLTYHGALPLYETLPQLYYFIPDIRHMHNIASLCTSNGDLIIRTGAHVTIQVAVGQIAMFAKQDTFVQY